MPIIIISVKLHVKVISGKCSDQYTQARASIIASGSSHNAMDLISPILL